MCGDPVNQLEVDLTVHHGAGEFLEGHFEPAGGVAQGQQRLIHRALLRPTPVYGRGAIRRVGQ
jgi:hypothetical protein